MNTIGTRAETAAIIYVFVTSSLRRYVEIELKNIEGWTQLKPRYNSASRNWRKTTRLIKRCNKTSRSFL